MEVIGYGVGEEEKLVVHRKVKNVKGRTLHGTTIYEDCVSLDVQKSENDEYVIFRSVDFDDPPLQKIEEVVENFIMCPTKFLRHATMHA